MHFRDNAGNPLPRIDALGVMEPEASDSHFLRGSPHPRQRMRKAEAEAAQVPCFPSRDPSSRITASSELLGQMLGQIHIIFVVVTFVVPIPTQWVGNFLLPYFQKLPFSVIVWGVVNKPLTPPKLTTSTIND